MLLHYSITHLLESEGGPLAQVDARVKLVLALLLLLLMGLVPPGDLESLRRLAGVVLVVVVVARVSLKALILRLLPLLPFGVLVLFIPFLHAGPSLWRWGWLEVTEPGVHRALEVGLRMGAMGLTMAVLSATTPPGLVLQALRALRVPHPLVETLGFLFRYLFLLIDEGQRMQRAWRGRGGEWSLSSLAQHSLGSLLALLFLRTFGRGERVYLAMLARGYAQDRGRAELGRIPPAQWVGGMAVALLLVVIRFVP